MPNTSNRNGSNAWRRLQQVVRWPALRDQLDTSLWIIPVTFTAGAFALAIAAMWIDHRMASGTRFWFIYQGGADGAREVLSTIASSMLTIAGLVFSITILVLQLASSQFSPRVLRTFLEDRVTQTSMGMFLGSFVYSMVLLPQVQSEESGRFVPRVSVYVGFALALLSVGFFVRYIHHMAHAIRAVNIIARVAEETRQALERMCPDEFLDEAPAQAGPTSEPDRTLMNLEPAGVVLSVEEDALVVAALAHDLVIGFVPRVGDFVPHGAPLYRIWGPAAHDAEALNSEAWCLLGCERTPYQDPMFGFRQLVDIAERALSPGTNDPTTATQALDQLHDLLRALARRRIPAPTRVDDEDRVRLVLPRPDWDDYVRLSFEEVRIYGRQSVQVVRKMRTMLTDLLSVAPPSRAPALQRELDLVVKAQAEALPSLTI